MQFEDIARLRVEILGEGAEKDLKSLNKSAKSIKDELHLIEVAGEKGSSKWQELKKLQRDLNAEIREQRKAVDLNNASYNELLGLKKSLNQELKKTKIGSDEWVAALKKIEPVNEKLKEAGDAMRSAGNEAKSQKSLWANFKEWVTAAFAVAAIVAFGRKVIDFGRQVFDLTAKFERYDTILKNALGSQGEAASAMQMIKDVAATTPISVDEMTDSYIKFINRGIKPTQEEVKNLADIAASQGKSFDQLTEAVLDAQMAEGERLKEFGIKMRKSGDDIALAFKGQTVTVKNNEKAIYDAIVAMGDYNGVAGMTSEISKTLEGRVSNLGDRWDFFRVSLGERLKPVFYAVIDLFNSGIDTLEVMSAHLTRIGKIVGTAAAAWLTYNVAIKASAAAATIKNGLMKVQQVLYGQALLARKALTGATITETTATVGATTAARAFNTALKANPIGLVITALTLAVTAYQGYKLAAEESKRKQEELNNEIAAAQAPLQMQQQEFQTLAETVLDGNKPLVERQVALDELKERYPDNLEGIDDLKDAEEKLGKVIRNTNADFVTRAKLLENEVRLRRNTEIATKAYEEKINLENKLAEASHRRITTVTGTAGVVQTFRSEAELIQEKIDLKEKEALTAQKANAEIAKSSEALLKTLNYSYETVKKNEEETTETKKKEGKKRTKNAKDAAEEETKEIKKQLTEQVQEIETKNVQELEGFKLKGKNIVEDWKLVQAKLLEIQKERAKAEEEVNQIPVYNFKSLWDDTIRKMKENIRDIRYWIASGLDAAEYLLNQYSEKLEKSFENSTDAIEKTLLTHKMAMADAGQTAIGAVDKLLQGDLLGAIATGVKALGTAMDSWISKQNDLFLAKLEKRKNELEEAGKMFVESAENFVNTVDLSRIDDIYSGLQDDFNFLDGVRLDLGEFDTAERRLEQEISIGENIVKNYNLAMKNEQEYSTQRIFNINEAYNLELQRISEKYGILATQGKQAYDADTQAVRENLSQQLLELITNEDSKTSVISDYAAKRSHIMQTFAMADMAITEDMDQSQIDAINTAIEARNKALADLQNWYNQELTFIVNNEEQKRKEYTETERLQMEANDALAQLALENQANEIELTRQKNQEIEAAELEKNINLEEEAARHNDVITQLGIEKDAALAESFNILKNIVTSGYDEIMAKAQEAYNQGMITAQQYNQLINQLNTLRGLTSQPLTVPSINLDNLNIPNFQSFESGGIIPSGALHSQGGIKLWDTMTGRTIGEIEGGEPILSRETYRNNKSLVDALLNSSVHRNGAKIFAGGSHYNYASPRYANGGVLPNSGSSALGFARPDSPEMQLMLKYLKDTVNEVALMREQHNELLDRIAKKPGGISLHELNSAVYAQNEAERVSNF